MPALAGDGDGSEERHDDQHIAGDFLGPGKAVIEHVAGEELQENDHRQSPQRDQARQIDQPDFDRPHVVPGCESGARRPFRALRLFFVDWHGIHVGPTSFKGIKVPGGGRTAPCCKALSQSVSFGNTAS